MFNIGIKKIVAGITSLVIIGGGSAFASHTVTATADEENAYQLVEEAKEDLTEQFTKQIEEIKTTNEEKDKQLAELKQQLDEANKKLQEQSDQETSYTETTTEKNTEDSSNYATHEYVDTTVNNAKEEVQNNTQQQITQELEDRGLHKPTEEEKANIPSSFCAPTPESNVPSTAGNHT